MNMIRLGLRNLLRNKSRLFFVAVLIGVPFFLLLVMQSIGAAVEQQTQTLRKSVDNTLQLRARGAMGHVNMVGNEDLLPKETLERIKRIEHVEKVEQYLLAMTPTEGSNFAMIVGLNPGDSLRLESHGEAGNPKIIAGRNLTEEDRGKNVAVIGQGFAKWAGITPENLEDATLTLNLKRTHPVIFALDRPPATLKIVGIYASGYVFGDMQLFMPIDTFRDVYGISDGAISWIFLKTDSAANLPQVDKKVRAEFGKIADIIAPTNVAAFQMNASRGVIRLSQGGIILSAILMVIVVFFVMLLVVRERAWEIGTFKALGASNGGIVVGFLTEAIALSVTGALLGTLFFSILGGQVAQSVFGLGVAPFLPPEYKDTLVSALTLSPDISAAMLGILASVCLIAAFAGSAWSVRQIIKLSPMEAIRHE
jgi:ABC-type antimicrobial peptide transport system permease subunit